MSDYPILDRIHSPTDVRALSRNELPALADELRRFLIESVSKTGGHLSSNLGTVELTVALHHVFNTPEERIVWDVGHQTYCHKILTQRRDAMPGLRHYGGISGFPRRAESKYDSFGTGHSSTSISAALAMAVAARDRGEARVSIAVIGDGAMSGGMAFEALNNAGSMKDINLLVILNDNEMSISPPVGALSNLLARLMAPYGAARRLGKKVLGIAPPMLDLARKVEEVAKGIVSPNSPATLFEELGFHYYGPVDGHDLDILVPTLQNLRNFKGPQFLHVVTRKGQGYKLAEADPIRYHGVSKFDHHTGLQEERAGTPPTYTQVFGDWLCEVAAHNPRVVGITPAMCEGSGLTRFAREFPKRYYDVGIAEQHALTFAAGLACEGYRPVVAIYSTFLQRAYDQLIHDIALQNLPVVLAIDRAGLAGADGATHHGAFDLSFLVCVPNMLVMTPADENECRQMLDTALSYEGPSAVRYPRGKGPGVALEASLRALPIGKGEIRRRSRKKTTALLVFGSLLAPALEAAEAIDATVANMRFVKPIDKGLITCIASRHNLLVTLEENSTIGGAGSEVARILESLPERPRLLRLGLPDRFVDHGEQRQLLAEVGLDAAGIISAIHAVEQST